MSNETPGPVNFPTQAPSTDVNQLSARVAALEARFSPNSWIYSNNFFKRALALWGHVIVIQLIIGVVIWAIFFVCALLFGGMMAGLGNR